jgi:hypothetical protein
MEAGITRPVTLGIGAAVVIVLGISAVMVLTPGEERTPPGLTEVRDPLELGEFLEMSHLGILTSTNFLGHRVYTVRAILRNTSDKTVRLVDVRLTFLDYDKKVVHEEIRSALETSQPPIPPGTEYQFEVAFENPPRTWNYHVPDTQVVRIAHER